MEPVTKQFLSEQFDQFVERLFVRLDQVLERHLDEKIAPMIERKLEQHFTKKVRPLVRVLDQKVDQKIEALAIITANGFKAVDDCFTSVEKRLDRIENIGLRGHDHRIAKLEDESRLIKTELKLR